MAFLAEAEVGSDHTRSNTLAVNTVNVGLTDLIDADATATRLDAASRTKVAILVHSAHAVSQRWHRRGRRIPRLRSVVVEGKPGHGVGWRLLLEVVAERIRSATKLSVLPSMIESKSTMHSREPVVSARLPVHRGVSERARRAMREVIVKGLAGVGESRHLECQVCGYRMNGRVQGVARN